MSSDPFDADAMLGRAEQAVAKAVAMGVDQAEVYITRDVSLELSIENNSIQSAGRSRTEGGGIRIVHDGRLGFAYFTADAQIESAIERAMQLSRLSPQKNMQLPNTGGAGVLASRWDDNIAQLEVSDALDLGNRLLAARLEVAGDMQLAGGGVAMGFGLEAIANHNGVSACDRATEINAGVNLVIEDGETAVNAWDSESAHVGSIAPEALVATVANDLQSLRNPQTVSGGPADILFRPAAVSELITGLVMSAVHGDDAARGKTVWSESMGDAVADSRLSLTDDPFAAGALGVGSFDGDGLPVQKIPIIQDGQLASFLFDTRDGHEHQRASTHSAIRSSFKSPPGVGPHHVVVTGSQAKPDAELIDEVEHGFIVESLLGAHTANATTGDFSVSAPNVWRIEHGEVVGAANEIAIGGNLPELLMRLDGIGSKPKQMDGAALPMLRFRDVNVST